jgi:hypothetical protein
VGANITYVCYCHHTDPLGTKLGQYSLLPNTPDDDKKSVNDGILDIVSFLESTSRSILYSLQSSITFLDVKEKYRIPDIYAHKHLDKDISTRGFANQFCVGVDYWLSIHIDNIFYYTTLSCLSENTVTIPSYFTLCFLPTESLFQCVLEMSFVSILLFTIDALIPRNMESIFLVVMSLQKHATPK